MACSERKMALITGSTSKEGIGCAIAKTLARDGYDIILHGRRDEDEITSLRKDIEKEFEVNAFYLKADLMIRAEIEQLCKRIEEIHPGGVDVLVNNAGWPGMPGAMEDYSVVIWDDVIKVNLTAPFDLIRLTIGDMKKRGWGRIINIPSIYSKKNCHDPSRYVCAKHGLNGLTKTVANDTFGTGATCNAICPAAVETQIVIAAIKQRAETMGLTYDAVSVR
ncbi:D-beta-hydroxybutyrate dehydrogenase-like [Saccoglossus kowalevskii]